MPGFAAGSANKLQQAIKRATHSRIDQFLYSLAIRHIGQRTARQLAQRFGSLNRILHASEEQLAAVTGQVAARNLHQFFASPSSKRLLRRLERFGIKLQKMPALKVSETLAGKTFVFTRTLSGFTREEAKAAVETRGGRTSSGVNQNTNYVVAGAKPGIKYRDAERLEIKIIDESEFTNLLRR